MKPEILTPEIAARLDRLKALADLLDSSFTIPGTRFRVGIEAIVGLLPGIGDTLGLVASAWLVREAHALGAPGHVKARMIGNILLDWVVGSVPLIGDFFDASFKANQRNWRLLRDHFGLG